MTTIYEAAGGMEVFVRLAEATHQRCLADDLLNHPFSHADNQPDHTGRGWRPTGPRRSVGRRRTPRPMGGSESHVQRLHAAEGSYMEEASPRFVACVVDSFDEAGVPDDPRVRQAITDYVTWAAPGPFQAWPSSADDVPADLPMPRWGWDGPVGPAD